MVHILVVEDEATIREFVMRVLQKQGYTVTIAVDGLTAVLLAQRQKPDLIVMDLTLPKLDGLSVARELKCSPVSADIPIMIMTGDLHLSEVETRAAGCDGLIAKPFSIDQFLAQVQALIRHKHPNGGTSRR